MKERLILCGGGHIARALAPLALMLDWDVTVLDDRAEFANVQRFPGCEVLCGSFPDLLERLEVGERDHIVIVTRGHAGDELCLRWALSRSHGYLGMIGSRGKIALLKKHLFALGITEEQFSPVHAPIGLDIGAQTPAEIAVAIAAEMIDWRYANGAAEPPLPDGPCLLAKIVKKHGSAPRGEGAWLALLPDGSFQGTIGGGAVEAAVERQLKELKARDCPFTPFTVHYDLSNRDAAGLGMACGGNVDVQFEELK